MAESRAKVLFILPNFAGGGAERVALTLLAHLDRDAFRPELAVLESTGPLRMLLAGDVALHDIGRSRLRQALPALLRLIRRERPSVVFATQGYLNIALLAARGLMPRGTKLAIRESSTPSLALPNRPRPRLMAWAYRRFYRRADLVFCQHRQTEQEMVSQFGVSKAKISRLPNPIPTAVLREEAVPVKRHPGSGRRFVAAGRLSAEKGYDRLIKLFVDLPNDCHLTIYGEGREKETLCRLVGTLGVDARVEIASFTDSLPAALAGADACIISSHWEGLPNVALEALAVGTPVIATPEAGGIAELADAAPDGAVAVIPWGTAFAAEMASREPRHPAAPAPSLLPERYALEKVAKTFNLALSRLAGLRDIRYEGQP